MARKSDDKNKRFFIKAVQFSLIGLSCLFIAFTLGNGFADFLRTSPLFRIKEVVANQSLQFIRSRNLDRLIGRNLFDVNIVEVERRLQLEYPQIANMRIYRQFPNRIYIDAKRRDPFAVILMKKQEIVVDREGAVLSFAPPPDVRLPLVSGAVVDHVPPGGRQLKNFDVATALAIIRAVQGNEHLRMIPVVSVDVTNLSRIQCALANEVKIIIDQDKIEQKIRMLGIVLSQGNLKTEEVNYIDLRFREPIIGKK